MIKVELTPQNYTTSWLGRDLRNQPVQLLSLHRAAQKLNPQALSKHPMNTDRLGATTIYSYLVLVLDKPLSRKSFPNIQYRNFPWHISLHPKNAVIPQCSLLWDEQIYYFQLLLISPAYVRGILCFYITSNLYITDWSPLTMQGTHFQEKNDSLTWMILKTGGML